MLCFYYVLIVYYSDCCLHEWQVKLLHIIVSAEIKMVKFMRWQVLYTVLFCVKMFLGCHSLCVKKMEQVKACGVYKSTAVLVRNV